MVRGNPWKIQLDNDPRRSETPLSKKTLLQKVLVYIQQLGSENSPVENAIIVIVCKTIFEKSGGAIAPASPMVAWCLPLTHPNP